MRHRKPILPIIIIILIVCLSACANKQEITEPNEQQNNGLSQENELPNNPLPIDEPVLLDLNFQPKSLVLSPDSKYKVSLLSSTAQSEQDLLTQPESDIVLTSSDSDIVTIDHNGIIHAAEHAKIGSTVSIQAQVDNLSTELTVAISYSLDDTVTASSNGIDQVTNATSIAVVVNKQRSLPDGYAPDDLVKPDVPFSFDGENERRYLRKEAAEALEQLFKQAKEDGIDIRAVSGYRTFATQTMLYNNYVRKDGEEKARQYSAVPGTSEHQTGLAMDVSSPSIGNRISTTAGFGETEEGMWLAEHAATYGFIIRYPEGKEEITGYVYEPWHLRYVGTELSLIINEQGLTLEEFFGTTIPVSQNID